MTALEPTLSKIPEKEKCRAPRLRPPDGGAKQNIFQFLVEEKGSRAKIEKREKCFALLLLTEQESGAAPTPSPALRNRQSGKNSFPLEPPSFLPDCRRKRGVEIFYILALAPPHPYAGKVKELP